MTMLDPTPERELPATRRAAIRDLLVAQAGSAHPTRPVLMTRRRLALAGVSLVGIFAAIQFWPASDGGYEDTSPPDSADIPNTENVAVWSAVPTQVDAVIADQLGDECRAFMSPEAPAEGWQHVMVDQRGGTAVVLLANPSTSVVNPPANDALSCLSVDVGQPPATHPDGPGQRVVSGVLTSYTPLADGESGDGLVPVETNVAGGYVALDEEEVSVGYSFGQTAAEVARVTVTLEDGTEMEASLSGGWYLAWWPAEDNTEAQWPPINPWAESITAYDASGTVLARHFLPRHDEYRES